MKRLTYMASILLSTLLAGCSQNSEIETLTEDVEISALAKSLSIDASTDASTRGAVTDAKSLKAVVLTSQATGDYALNTTIGTGKLYAKGTMTFNATTPSTTAVTYDAIDFTGNTKLPGDRTNLYMAALYPGVLNDWTAIGTTASYVFNGTQDVMAAPQQTVKRNASTASDQVAAFVFGHLLTKIDIKIAADNTGGKGADVIAAWGQIQEISITKVLNKTDFFNKATVTLATGKAATTTAFAKDGTINPTEWKTYKADDTEYTGQTTLLTTTPTLVATTMMAPFTATNATTDLELTIKSKTANQSVVTTIVGVKIPAGDTQNKQYSVNLTFKAIDISATAAITAWATSVDVPTDII